MQRGAGKYWLKILKKHSESESVRAEDFKSIYNAPDSTFALLVSYKFTSCEWKKQYLVTARNSFLN